MACSPCMPTCASPSRPYQPARGNHMPRSLVLERGHFEAGIVPVADFLVNGAGTASDVINMKQYEFVRFVLFWGVGATGTNTLTIEACDDVVPTNKVAVPFWYRQSTAFGAIGGIPFPPLPATRPPT